MYLFRTSLFVQCTLMSSKAAKSLSIMRPVKPFLHILLQFRIRGRDFDVGQATYYLRLSSASPPGVVGIDFGAKVVYF